MTFRSEIKFRLTRAEGFRLKSQLKMQGMEVLYPSRTVKSIYFDNAAWTMFHESNEGILPRKKFRLRTYGDNVEMQRFEMKVSSLEGRYKESIAVDRSAVEKLLKSGRYLLGYGLCTARIRIIYQREYFKFNNLRLTFDRDLHYSNYHKNWQYADSEVVMEIKFDHGGSCESIYKVANLIPSRFSKYERAVKMTANES